MRPVLFFPAWSTLLLAYISESKIQDYSVLFFNSDLMLRIFSFAGIMGASFVINQIVDVDSDRENQKLPILSSGKLSNRAAWIFSILLSIMTLLISFLFSLYIFYLNLIFLTITAYLYNIKPFKLKDHSILGAIANYLMGVLAYLYALDSFYISDFESFILISSINFSLFILTTLPDIKGDKKIRKRTIGSVLGIKKAIWVNMLFMLIVLMFSLLFRYKITYVSYLYYLHFFISVLLVINCSIENIIFMIKLFLLVQALLVCVFFPDYFIFLIMMYLGGRVYYKSYFNINYPHIKNE